ncbi:MAG: CHAT domain-containing protein [Treponema sp.]|nr:CHAT domain-containing protein [Treponema sp.]
MLSDNETAESFYEQSEKFIKNGDYSKAIEKLERALQLKPDYYDAIMALGIVYRLLEDDVSWIKYEIKLKNIEESIRKKDTLEYFMFLFKLGSAYYYFKENNKAWDYYRKAEKITKNVQVKKHPFYTKLLRNMGKLYIIFGNFLSAKKYLLKFKNIEKRTWRKDPLSYSDSLIYLAHLYSSMGDYNSAIKNYLEAKNILKKTPSKKSLIYVNLLNDLSQLYQFMGDYSSAKECSLEAKDIKDDTQEKDVLNDADSLRNLGEKYLSMGNFKLAEENYLKANDIIKSAQEREPMDYMDSLVDLSELYLSKGDFDLAEIYLLKAYHICVKTPNKNLLINAGMEKRMGKLYLSKKDDFRAEEHLLEAKHYWELLHNGKMIQSKEHPNYAILLDDLGHLYRYMVDYEKAKEYFLEAKKIREIRLGVKNQVYAISLNNLNLLYCDMGNYAQAIKYKLEADILIKTLVIKNFSLLSTRQRNHYGNEMTNTLEASYFLSWFYTTPESNSLSYDNTLFIKGLLLRTANAVRDSIYNTNDKKLISQFEELDRLKQKIEVLLQRNDGNESYIHDLELKANTLDEYLTQTSRAFKEFYEDFNLGWQNVRDHLQANEAAIEFVSFILCDKYDEQVTVTQYAALILRTGMDAPEWVPLCEESQLASIFKKSEGEKDSQRITNILYNENNYDLYNTVWKPLKEVLEGVKTIYYSPSGLLHKISFSAIPVEKGKHLTDIYDLNLVSSTREVVRRNTKRECKPKSAVVYGGIYYNLSSESIKNKVPENQDDLEKLELHDELKKRSGEWEHLAYSAKESEEIHKRLKEKDIVSELYMRAEGNKESFKSTDKQTNVIHLATHGFFIQDDRRNNKDYEWLERLGGGKRVYLNPLLRSGLVFAGGNNCKKGEQVDSILLANEVAQMNLTGAVLVALSACETGLGEVDNSEGVFGLQRAFKLAGAQTIIMSLWQVEDKSSQMMMTDFYRNWLSGKSKQDAFREAQKKIRKLYPDPYNWAAFVLIDGLL